VKTLDSLIKKLILKPNRTYESLPDKVGVRVISSDRTGVCDVIEQRFRCLSVDDKSKGRPPDQLGYPGVHFDVSLREGDEDFNGFIGLQCEIQLRTYAEHAWCEVSHKLAYKSALPNGEEQMPDGLRRRLMLIIGLLEMADLNISDVSKAMRALPAFALSRAVESLERFYYQFTTRPPDRGTSFTVIEMLLHLYPGGVDEMEICVSTLVSEKQDVLAQVFERNEQLEEPRAALFFQPETLAIRDLMERKREALLESWRSILPEDELFDLGTEFGFRFDDITE
jgi:ppGpp synthetase/RelA/SpoT-type nucleotidyltranferase